MIVALYLPRHERQRRQHDEDARAKVAQANQVAAWCTGTELIETSPHAWMSRINVRCQNQSDQPIFNLKIMSNIDWPQRDGGRMTFKGGWTLSIDGIPKVLGPGRYVDGVLQTTKIKDPNNDSPLWTWFTDINGRHWLRDPFGQLEEQDKNIFDDRGQVDVWDMLPTPEERRESRRRHRWQSGMTYDIENLDANEYGAAKTSGEVRDELARIMSDGQRWVVTRVLDEAGHGDVLADGRWPDTSPLDGISW